MRRGISPIIATILLIIMTVGIAALMYTWMSGMLGQLTTTTSQQVIQQASFNFQASGVLAQQGTKSFLVAITNTGSVRIDSSVTGLVITAVAYSKLQPGTPRETVTCTSNATVQLNPGQVGLYNITCAGLTSNIDLTQYYYVITISMGGITQPVTFS